MHGRLILGFTLLFLHGCAWSPERDNAVDPDSPFYSTPPQANRPPEIASMAVVTDCIFDVFASACGFEIRAAITDADQNLDFRSVLVEYEPEPQTAIWEPIGLMSYSAERGYFVIHRTQFDFPGDDLEPLVGDSFRVTVRDDSGARAERGDNLPEPRTDFPTIIEPKDQQLVATRTPLLIWFPWSDDPTSNHFYDVAVYLQGYALVWDTLRLPADSDTIQVTEPLLSSSEEEGIFYGWTVTVEEPRGNRMTSEMGFFRVVAPAPEGTASGQIVFTE